MILPVLGIDIGKEKFDAALLTEKGIKTRVFGNDVKGFDACNSWLDKLEVNPHICLEATGIYGLAFASYMFENNYNVSVVNPLQIKRFSESELSRNKTDKSDAQVIARFCVAMKPASWRPAPSHLAELRHLATYLESLNLMLSQESNRLDSASKEIAKHINQHIKQLEKLILSIKENINKIFDNDKDLKEKKLLLETIPGVGYETTIRILAYINNIEDFDSAKQLAAFAGLSPKQHQSGSSVHRRTTLSKTGDQKLRRALYMPALVAVRYNPVLKEFYERLTGNGKSKMAALGAVMRKLLHIVYGILKSGKPFDPNFNNAR
jgi:transposase